MFVRGDERRNRPLRIHEGLEHLLHFAVTNDDRGDLGDAIAMPRPRTCGLDVHHDVRKRCKKIRGVVDGDLRCGTGRRGLDAAARGRERVDRRQSNGAIRWCVDATRFRHAHQPMCRTRRETPLPALVPRELGPAGEQRGRHVLGHHSGRVGKLTDVPDQGDDVGRPGREIVRGALGETHLRGARHDATVHDDAPPEHPRGFRNDITSTGRPVRSDRSCSAVRHHRGRAHSPRR